MKKLGVRLGNGLTTDQAISIWTAPAGSALKDKRDRALLAVLLACGLRRHEAVMLTLEHLQRREEHWVIVDLIGKGSHVRTVPVPDWVRQLVEEWLVAAGVTQERVFRRVNKAVRTWGAGNTEKAVWYILWNAAKIAGITKLAPHDLRHTCARLCHAPWRRIGADPVLAGPCLDPDD